LFKANETQKRIKMKEKVYCVTGCWSEIKQDRIVASRVVLFIHEKVTDAVTSYWYKKKKKKRNRNCKFSRIYFTLITIAPYKKCPQFQTL
jgi:hypothetical protein